LTPLEGFGLLDVIDVLILAALIYQGYALLIGSRAWNVFRGWRRSPALWFLATLLGLDATSAMFDRLAPVGFLAVVVVFQPELRAALERFGRGRRRGATGDPVQEVMIAVRELAQQRVGALVAIEQTTPLREYGRAGTELGTHR
jgi:diadenylate cyclase